MQRDLENVHYLSKILQIIENGFQIGLFIAFHDLELKTYLVYIYDIHLTKLRDYIITFGTNGCFLTYVLASI